MKKIILSIAIAVLGFTANAQDNNVGIGTVTPDASAKLDVSSDSKGFLPPRLTEAQRDAIANPATGLMIYNSSENCLQMNTGTPATPEWFCLISTAGLKDTDGDGIIDMVDPLPDSSDPVVQTATGRIWMDKNLGAVKVASYSSDEDAYGDLYQWGRAKDGHQIRTSGIVAAPTTVTSSDPGHGDFILADSTTDDNWTDFVDEDNLWQGVSGINNPCPSGYRLPTNAEWTLEVDEWGARNSEEALANALKLPNSGARGSDGTLYGLGTVGRYWSSTVSGTSVNCFNFGDTYASPGATSTRDLGMTVRCIKD